MPTRFEMLAFCEGRAGCCRCCEVPAADNTGQTSRPRAGEQLRLKKLPVSNPYEAPVGSVLVYGAKSAAGHVEIRTEDGFVSDFRSKIPSRRPLLGVFAKS